MPTDAPSGRHKAYRHRGPSRYEQTRDAVCDRIIDVQSSLPGKRALAVTAVGGVLATGAVVGAQTVVGGSTDQVSAAPVQGSLYRMVDAHTADVSRSTERTPLADATATDPDEAVNTAKAKARAEARAAAERKKAKAKAAAEAERKRIEAEKNRDPRAIARDMLADFGWTDDQFSCLDSLWVGESGWNPSATNPSSGAYGIPQALPGTKMASAGSDWQTNPVTQITWGLGYIEDVYGTPCGAESFKQGNGWY